MKTNEITVATPDPESHPDKSSDKRDKRNLLAGGVIAAAALGTAASIALGSSEAAPSVQSGPLPEVSVKPASEFGKSTLHVVTAETPGPMAANEIPTLPPQIPNQPR